MIDLAQTILGVTLRVFFAAWVLAATVAVLVFVLFAVQALAHLTGVPWLSL